MCHPPADVGHYQYAKEWAHRNLRVNRAVLTDPSQITYVYRWGVSSYHLSGFSDMAKAYRDAPAGPPGTYTINPRMGHKDYYLAREVYLA